jgi:hypothetical protein
MTFTEAFKYLPGTEPVPRTASRKALAEPALFCCVSAWKVSFNMNRFMMTRALQRCPPRGISRSVYSAGYLFHCVVSYRLVLSRLLAGAPEMEWVESAARLAGSYSTYLRADICVTPVDCLCVLVFLGVGCLVRIWNGECTP